MITCPAGQARSFTATVLGSSNPGVNWTASGGSPVSGSGASFTWTPPASAAAGTVFTLTAASVADPARTATVSFTVSSSITGVSVAPATVALGPGGAQAFTATVTGTGSFSPALSWTVVEAGGGSVNGTGAYTAPSAPGTYHVKATSTQDPLQSGLATVTVSASVPKPAISYPLPVSRVFAVGTAIAAWTPTNSGGAASSWSVAPALPAGLVLSTSTGVITGTPTATSPATTYTVTASNAGGFGTTTISITVNPALTAPSISYPTPDRIFPVGTAIPTWTPANGGGAASTWSVSPTLPAGLVLSTSTGVISGTPTAVSPATTYTVTASNAAGPGTTTVSITVVVGLPIPTYTPIAQVYTVGTAIATWAPSNGGGAASGWAINPALPAGLSFNVTNGQIIGTPTVASPATPYTVTASNATGGGQTAITVTVNQPGLGPMTWKRDIAYLGGRQVAEIDKTGAIRVTLTDHLGSPRLLVDPGGTVSEQKFMPFGESLTDTTTMGKSAKGFTGHEQTDPSGLIYMQARFYAPMYHRFLSPDPGRDQHFEETQSWNIYSYVRNNPVSHTDPTGMLKTYLDGIERDSGGDGPGSSGNGVLSGHKFGSPAEQNNVQPAQTSQKVSGFSPDFDPAKMSDAGQTKIDKSTLQNIIYSMTEELINGSTGLRQRIQNGGLSVSFADASLNGAVGQSSYGTNATNTKVVSWNIEVDTAKMMGSMISLMRTVAHELAHGVLFVERFNKDPNKYNAAVDASSAMLSTLRSAATSARASPSASNSARLSNARDMYFNKNPNESFPYAIERQLWEKYGN